VPCDQNTRSCWADWPEMREHANTEVMARQVLNAELGIKLAQMEGIEWLAHLDADELLYSHDVPLQEYFAALPQETQQVTFLNYEAQVEQVDVVDFFREVTLFKRSPQCLPPDALIKGQELLRSASWSSERWFLYYTIGKSAVRLVPGVRPQGVHRFWVPNERNGSLTTCKPAVLHYINSGFGNFWNKYLTWGNFPDTWFGLTSIKSRIGTLHLEARDVVRTGDRELARDFYHRRFVASQPELVEQLIAIGAMERIPYVRHALLDGD